MHVKELKKEGLKHDLEIVIEAKEIGVKIDEQLRKVGRTVKMPGFRPGKVPFDMIKQKYGRAVLGDVLDQAVNEGTAKALKDKNLRPALQPKIEVKEFDEGKDLKYTLSVEVLPDFTVIDLKTLKLEKPIAKVEDKVIDEALQNIAKNNRDAEKVERKSKTGDMVMIDFHGRTAKDNKEHEGMHAHGHMLELGSNQFITGFEEQLTGKSAGDKVEVKVTFPAEYHAADLAGQDAIFDVEIHEVHAFKDADINEDFAKKLGMETVEALRKAVSDMIQRDYDGMSRLKLKRVLLDALDESHDFDVPEGMKEMEYTNIVQQLKMERQAELKDGEIKLEGDEEEELRAIAERRVRLGMVLAEVGRSGNIRVSDQELQRAVIQEAQRFPGSEAQVFEYFRKNRQALEALRAPVFEDKVVDYIVELATVTEKEVAVDDLKLEEDESYLDLKKKGKKTSGAKKKKDDAVAAEGEEEPKKKATKKK